MLFLLPLAAAAPVEGEIFGKPFRPVAALGLADPAQPGVFSVLLASEGLTCAKARAMREAGAKAKKSQMPVMVVAAFTDPSAGASAAQVLAMGPKGLAGFVGTVTLGAMPSAVGERGTATYALTVDPKSKEGAFGEMQAAELGDRVSGEASFELCDVIAARPSLAGTRFEARLYHVVEESNFPGEPPDVMDLEVALPVGWTEGKDPLNSPQWTAPDGLTRLALHLVSPTEPFEEGLRAQMTSQVDAFRTEQTTGELVRMGLQGDHTFVARWRNRWGDGPWTHHLVVFRQGAGWPHAVQCTVEGDDRAVAEVFDAAEAACSGLLAAN